MTMEIGGQGVGPSVRVVRHGRTLWKVISTPFPVHWGAMVRLPVPGDGYLVTIETAQAKPRTFRDYEKALHHAGTMVGALYRVDMRSKFTGPQRFAMGRNLCPKRIPCPDGAQCLRWPPGDRNTDGPPIGGHYHLCLAVPGDVSIWCEAHGARIDSPGDAFRRLDDSHLGPE